MVAVWRIGAYHLTDEPVTGPVTKFGGQPHWLGEPQWPLSAFSGTPMRFVCQLALDPALAGPGPERLAYVFVFVTHGEPGDDDFDPDVIYPDGGENAVIVQPGDFTGPATALATGPTLYHADGSPAEYTVDLLPADDPEPLSPREFRALPAAERDAWFETVDRDKIGGTVLVDEWPAGGPWRPLLRLATNWTPFHLNLGAAPVAFAFLSADARSGCLLVEDS